MNTVREFLGLFFSLLYSQNNGIYNVGVAFVFITAGAELVLNIFWNQEEKKRDKLVVGNNETKRGRKKLRK